VNATWQRSGQASYSLFTADGHAAAAQEYFFFFPHLSLSNLHQFRRLSTGQSRTCSYSRCDSSVKRWWV
jgi:hypothetical protein